MDGMSEKPPDSQTNYTEDISKLEEILASNKANMKKLEVENAEEKEKLDAMLKDRSSFYKEVSDIEVDITGLTLQESAKKVLSVAVYNHYKRLAWQGDGEGDQNDPDA